MVMMVVKDSATCIHEWSMFLEAVLEMLLMDVKRGHQQAEVEIFFMVWHPNPLNAYNSISNMLSCMQ